MNKKGYTLIELIAVVIIIAILSTIVAINLNNSVDKSDINKVERFEKDLEKAACAYVGLDDTYEELKTECRTDGCDINMDSLINVGLISDDMKDPVTDHELRDKIDSTRKYKDCFTVRVSYDNEGTKECSFERKYDNGCN